MLSHLAQFGAGRRICIGKHIGILEVKKMISYLLLSYDVSFEAQLPSEVHVPPQVSS